MANPSATIAARRAAAVQETMAEVRALIGRQGPTGEAVAAARDVLLRLADQRVLFPAADFPLAPKFGVIRRHRLAEEADGTYSLSVYSLCPGTASVPHSHNTWAAIAAIEGEELNRLYRRRRGGLAPGPAIIEECDRFAVRPGFGLAMGVDDIHSIAVTSPHPTLHLHLYGVSMEVADDRRLGFDLASGTCAVYRSPSIRFC